MIILQKQNIMKTIREEDLPKSIPGELITKDSIPLYYKPQTNEFHIGYEYEYLNFNNDWIVNSIFTIEDIKFCIEELRRNKIRTKYLTCIDISDCGFTLLQNGIYIKNEIKINWILVQIAPMFGKYKIEIRCSAPSYNYGGFYGICRNKSELRIIMKQLGISN